ncbi:hypothetical protein [Bradyrhizobium sp. Ec3.3]|uniref:hypothetical protein n=1 Tax=Bradyrhizobium sp. Ec3.3 TaxID=189753 RepID=UPI0018DC3AE6|nr:hypothetical protein [Bradyrhizobium sp. Ec3.3]
MNHPDLPKAILTSPLPRGHPHVNALEEAMFASRMRVGAGALVVSGVLFVIYPALRPFSDESSLLGAPRPLGLGHGWFRTCLPLWRLPCRRWVCWGCNTLYSGHRPNRCSFSPSVRSTVARLLILQDERSNKLL